MTPRALIIGIDTYKDASRLFSCVNDTILWKHLLMERFGFQKTHICCLNEFKSTKKANVVLRLEKFFKRLQVDDFGLFIFSGHGGRFEVRRAGKRIRMQGLRTSDDVLYEDEIARLLKRHSKESSRLVSIIDACNSGGLAAEGLEGGNPELPERKRIVDKDLKKMSSALFESNGAFQPKSDNQVSLLACGAMENAFADNFDNKMTGVFTHYLTTALRLDPAITFKAFIDQISTHLPDTTKGYFQTPRYVGTADNLNQRIIM